MTLKELKKLITGIEWTDVEFKESRKSLPKSVWETVCSFSNTDGGYIILGIKETDGQFSVSGIDNPEKIQSDFLTTLRGKKFNIQLSSKGYLLKLSGKQVLVFKISSMPRQAKPIYFNGDIRNTYIRLGSTDQRCSKEEVSRMLRDASDQTSDSLLLKGFTLRHLDKETITGYRRYLKLREPSHPFLKMKELEFLKKIGAVKGRNLTVAGLLLFGNEEHIFSRFPSFELSIYQMPENDNQNERWQDRKIYNKNIIQTYIETLSYLKKFIPIPFKLGPDNMTRVEMVPSYITVREALANLLMHRDYFDTGIPSIRNYNDKIQFRNPGASLLSLDEMLKEAETAPRNPIIARIFRLVGWAEIAGSGMYKMQSNWKKAGFPVVRIKNNSPRGWFTLELDTNKPAVKDTIKEKRKKIENRTREPSQSLGQGHKQSQNKIKPEPDIAQRILKSLTYKPLSRSEIAQYLKHRGISSALKKAIKNLMAQNIIEYTIPEKPNSRLQKYRLVDK